jgi:hypothetical protein
MHAATQETFIRALDRLVEQVKQDRSILAAILCGSLSHDTVWEKSDIDLVLVTIDDKKIAETSVAIDADGLNTHAFLLPRARFRQLVEGSRGHSFMHSLLAKGRLLYTHDETIAALCARLGAIGERDAQLQLLHSATYALGCLYKARKWLVTRADLDYAALWILYAATPLAQIELIAARQVIDREVIPRAQQLNPSFFKTVYTDLLNSRKTAPTVEAALAAAEQYIAERRTTIFALVLDYLREAGETRSCTEIENHFTRNFGVSDALVACEYLADERLIGKASMPVQLTKVSNVSVPEVAFFSLSPPADDF